MNTWDGSADVEVVGRLKVLETHLTRNRGKGSADEVDASRGQSEGNGDLVSSECWLGGISREQRRWNAQEFRREGILLRHFSCCCSQQPNSGNCLICELRRRSESNGSEVDRVRR